MIRSRKSQLIDFNPEPERLIRRNLQKIKEIVERSPTRRNSKSLDMDFLLVGDLPMMSLIFCKFLLINLLGLGLKSIS